MVEESLSRDPGPLDFIQGEGYEQWVFQSLAGDALVGLNPKGEPVPRLGLARRMAPPVAASGFAGSDLFRFIALYRGVSGQSNHGVGWVAPLKKPDAEDAEMGWRRRQLRAVFRRG